MQQAAAQIHWGHNIIILDKITGDSVRKYLADMYEKNGDYESEAAVLEESTGLDEKYAGIVCKCHEKLAELYKRTGDKDKYHKRLDASQ